MHSKKIASLLLVNLVIVLIIPFSLPAENVYWWDSDWSYRQEISLPFDTSSEFAIFQPIDVPLFFENPCWAEDEQNHSVRVLLQDGNTGMELDSQIYDLEYSDQTHIQSCSLVFLIPQQATGTEQYYVYYDDAPTSSPTYDDHVHIEESYYRYEPISGYPLQSEYYKIVQDGYIIYTISLDGELMRYSTSQHVTKMKPNTTDVMPKNGELFAAFHFGYYYDQGLFDFSATSQALVSKEIFVNGNLMVEFGVVSTTKRNDVQTTAVYKYYYCPAENTRIHVHVTHEVLEELYVAKDINTDGTYAVLQAGGIKSSSIPDLNFGEIPPYIHVSTEQDIIEEYPIDTDPEYIPEDPDIRVLSTNDDVDAGEKPWGSFDYGESGVCHAIIFDSNQVVKSGTDERDGIQIKAHEMDYPHLPGVENNMAPLFFGRNSYEQGDSHDRVIPDDLVVEFDAEFFSTQTQGYSIIPEETELFQHLVSLKPSYKDDLDTEPQQDTSCRLTVFVHLAPSFPMGSAFAALSGINFSFISAELYAQEEFIISGAMGRLLLQPLNGIAEASALQKIGMILSSFDYRNMSLFKRICFQDIQPGRYVVKIFKENPILGRERQFIGYDVVDVSDETTTRIFCRPQASFQLSVRDQHDTAVSTANVVFSAENGVIAQGFTDEDGRIILAAPVQVGSSYDLVVYYNGFIIYNDTIRLPFLRSIIPLKIAVDMQRYDLGIFVQDTWGLPPEISLNPLLTSKDMQEPQSLQSEHTNEGGFLFTNLPEASYQLTLQYKSFTVEQEIHPPCEDVDIIFPAEFTLSLHILNSRGMIVEDAKVVVSREGQQVEQHSNASGVSFLLPPGTYLVDVYDGDDLIGSRKIDVFDRRSFDIITTIEPVLYTILTIGAVGLGLAGIVISYRKRNSQMFVKILAIALVLLAIGSPWWMLQGKTPEVETKTTMYLLPVDLITTTTTEEVISGERAFLPDLFITVILLIPLFGILACFCLLISLLFAKRNAKYNMILLLVVLCLFAVCLVIFSVGMNELAKVGIGSFHGQGVFDVSIPGEELVYSIECSWGPYVGFYLYLLSFVLIFSMFVIRIRKMMSFRARS